MCLVDIHSDSQGVSKLTENVRTTERVISRRNARSINLISSKRKIEKGSSSLLNKKLCTRSSYVLLYMVLLTVNFVNLTDARPKIPKADCNNGGKKLVTPSLSPFPKKGTKSPWQLCCDDVNAGMPGNLDVNFVWIIESLEKMYFFVTGMSMLLQSSLGMFRLVEPNVCENALSTVEGKIVRNHLQACVKDALEDNTNFDNKVDELVKALKR